MLARGVRNDDRELIAAESRHEPAFADRALQPRCDFDQQLIARLMPLAVVDLLEIVEIQEQDRESVVPTRELFQPLQQERAIGQPGE